MSVWSNEMDNHNLMKVGSLQYLYTNIAKAMMSSLDSAQNLNEIMTQVELFFNPKNWSLFRFDPVTNQLFFYMAKGIDGLPNNLHFKLGEGIVGLVAKTGHSIILEDASKHPSFSKKVDQLTGIKTKSLIAVPIKFQDQILGVIELINTHMNKNFTGADLHILETIADFGAIALKNSMAHEEVYQMAMRDPLTGVYNRASLQELFRSYSTPLRVLQEIRDKEAPYVLVTYIDIDQFKKINDQFGHRIGDQVLQKVSKILLSCCKDDDFVCRLGGDEFIILTMHLHHAELKTVKQSISDYLTQASTQIAPASGFSFGMADGMKADIEKLIETADQNMYKNKSNKKPNAST